MEYGRFMFLRVSVCKIIPFWAKIHEALRMQIKLLLHTKYVLFLRKWGAMGYQKVHYKPMSFNFYPPPHLVLFTYLNSVCTHCVSKAVTNFYLRTVWTTYSKSLMLCKKVYRAHRLQANQEQAKQALTPVIIIQLAGNIRPTKFQYCIIFS